MSTAPHPAAAVAGTRSTSVRRSNSIAIPARTQGEAVRTLTGIAGGSLLGTGQTFRTDIASLR